jgi:hypothetical protein
MIQRKAWWKIESVWQYLTKWTVSIKKVKLQEKNQIAILQLARLVSEIKKWPETPQDNKWNENVARGAT